MVTSLAPRQLLWRYLAPQRGRVVALALLLLASIALHLLNPQIIRYFIDQAQAGGSQRVLGEAALLFLLVTLVQQGTSLAARYLGTDVGWVATNTLRADLVEHCLDLDMGFHNRHTPGELIERVDGDVGTLASFFAHFVIQIVGNLLLLVGVLLLLLRESWLVGGVIALHMLLLLLFLQRSQGWAVSHWAAARQASAEHYGFIEEHLGGREDTRSNGAEGYVLQRLDQLARRLLRQLRQARVRSNLTFVAGEFLFALGYTLGLGLAALLFQRGEVTLGGAYLIVYYVGIMAIPLAELRQQAVEIQQAAASVGRVGQLLQLPHRLRREGHRSLPSGPLAVRFQGVSFQYESGESVLDGIRFDLPAGHVLGILGRSGSGKSTLVRLLFRLYDPTEGRICLEGIDLRELPLATLRARVGIVTQEVQLFRATLRDNLTFFDPQISDARLLQALESLELREWLDTLPAGLDTLLGAGGQGFSAGEAQLLAFTRLFLRDPGLVILDEASSRLDPATEQRLERAVTHLLAGRSAIIIAHRLATVQRVDSLLLLEGGRVVEQGPRAALAADPNSRFAHLLRVGLEETLT